jgi:hypothetical protein
MGWSQFLTMHWEVLAATDFFTVEVATWYGLVTYDVLVVMERSTRRVEIAGITPHPTAVFMQQCARQRTDHCDGLLLDKCSLSPDRDSTCTAACDQYVRNNRVEPIVLPPKSPHLNAHCERCVRSITEEALDRMICMGEASLRYAIRCYVNHDHAERNHRGLDYALIAPEPEIGRTTGRVKRRAYLGGLLNYYHREAA